MAVNEYQIQGLDAVLARLENLKYETKFKGGRAALRKAAQLVANAAKVNAKRVDDPETAKSIADNIAIRWNARLYKSSGTLGFRIGVMKGAVLPKPGERVDESAGAATPEWRMAEFGSVKMRATPILRPALADNISPAIDEFVKQYDLTITRALKKAAKTGVFA